jgi:MOSC domain-containing protein YiiM
MAGKLGRRVYQLNKKPEIAGQGGLPKEYVKESYITFQGLEGDFNRYRHEKRKGEPDMAVLLLPLETLSELNREGWPIMPGHLGENITTYGIPYDEFSSGKKYRIGILKYKFLLSANLALIFTYCIISKKKKGLNF